MKQKAPVEKAEGLRWTAKRKANLVVEILKGKTTIAEACRQHDLTPEVTPGPVATRTIA